jgi:hypothetical protein
MARQCVRLAGKQNRLGLLDHAPASIELMQGVQMLLMFPIVIAVTLLLAIGEIVKAEARLNRFNVTQ